MPTRQMTIRVADPKRQEWQAACERAGTNVSDQIRRLMDDWVASVEGTQGPTVAVTGDQPPNATPGVSAG